MKHCGTQELETERLVLRRLSIDISEMMYNNWASDRQVTHTCAGTPPHARADGPPTNAYDEVGKERRTTTYPVPVYRYRYGTDGTVPNRTGPNRTR